MIAIVTDSSIHLHRQEAEGLGITVVPMHYSLPGRPPFSECYMDQDEDFERLVDQNMGQLRTSQATYASFASVFEELLAAGAQILCLTISSRLSGTYGNAAAAARELAPQRIAVVDSLTTSGGLYQMALEARKLIDAGATLVEAANALRGMRGRIKMVFTVDDIEPLRRSGRLGGVRLSISTILNIRPVLRCVDGSIVSTGVIRGRVEQLKTLAGSLPEYPCTCVVDGFMAEEQKHALKRRVEAAGHRVILRQVGPVLAIHLGRGCLGISWIEREEQAAGQ
jgi:DegV family protein with EDD domain